MVCNSKASDGADGNEPLHGLSEHRKVHMQVHQSWSTFDRFATAIFAFVAARHRFAVAIAVAGLPSLLFQHPCSGATVLSNR
ncbi:hypothetical protein HJFPF1_08258 [Paramyrothecium foliicola]|nr:hypothetical protein HJFPF1_08258 [Paramyrothecium foliicola]